MNNLGQFELEPIPLLMGIGGGVLSWIMASRMQTSIIGKLFTVAVTAIACYFLAKFIADR